MTGSSNDWWAKYAPVAAVPRLPKGGRYWTASTIADEAGFGPGSGFWVRVRSRPFSHIILRCSQPRIIPAKYTEVVHL